MADENSIYFIRESESISCDTVADIAQDADQGLGKLNSKRTIFLCLHGVEFLANSVC